MRILGIIMNSIFLLVMLSVAGLFMMPYLPFDHGVELRIVESGSMEPAIMTGSLIVVRPYESYQAGDVIMFDSPQAAVPTTHRIIEVLEENGRTQYITKGDANEEADPGVVHERQVFGTVAAAIPRAGFVLDFARQPIGFIFLIVLPALLIVFGEVEKIWRELRARRREHDDDERGGAEQHATELRPVAQEVAEQVPSRSMMDIATPVRVLRLPTLDLRRMTPYRHSTYRRPRVFSRHAGVLSVVVFSLLIFSSSLLGSTVSYFNDTEMSTDNFFEALALDVAAVPDGNAFSFLGTDIVGGDDTITVDVSLEAGSALAHYDVTTEVIGTSTPLCDAVSTDAALPASYTGPVPLLAATDVSFDIPWEIVFSLPDESGLPSVDMCAVEIVLTAWHQDEALGDGYFDEERVPLLFTYTAPITMSSFRPLTGNGLSASLKRAVDSVASGSGIQEKVEDTLGLLEDMSDTFFEPDSDEEEVDSLAGTEGDEESEAEASGDAAGEEEVEVGGQAEETEATEVTEETEQPEDGSEEGIDNEEEGTEELYVENQTEEREDLIEDIEEESEEEAEVATEEPPEPEEEPGFEDAVE